MASLTALSKSNTSFSLALFKELGDNDKTANIFYSPFSISSALAMVLLGARGNTATQMREVGTSTSAPMGRSSRQPCRWSHPLQPGWQLRHFSRLLPKRRRASGHHGCVAEAEVLSAWGVATCIFLTEAERPCSPHTVLVLADYRKVQWGSLALLVLMVWTLRDVFGFERVCDCGCCCSS